MYNTVNDVFTSHEYTIEHMNEAVEKAKMLAISIIYDEFENAEESLHHVDTERFYQAVKTLSLLNATK